MNADDEAVDGPSVPGAHESDEVSRVGPHTRPGRPEALWELPR
jgi:hypothetical protein